MSSPHEDAPRARRLHPTNAQRASAGVPHDPRGDPETIEPSQWLSIAEVGDHLGLKPSRIRQLLRDGQLAGVRHGGETRVPADFLDARRVVKGLPGTITLLRDSGYSDEEVVRWLYTPDESLPGTPIQALRENRGTEVKRRAQAAGF